MRSYLLYSSSAHFLLLAGVFILLRGSFSPAKQQAYYIDFVGPSSVVTMAKAAAKPGAETVPVKEKAPASAPAAKKEKPEEDDFSSSAPLPKPSILSSGAKLFDMAAAAPEGEAGTPLIADTANFPFPWYITQVREALWSAWMERMPSGGNLRCTVRFNIARSGAARAVAVEKSSGNRLFDNAAESAAQSASPFEPLPDDFMENQLTVHVEFKAAQ